MRMLLFQAQNGPFVMNNFFWVQTIIITFIYLLGPFFVQNFKKILPADPKYEDAQFLDPKWEFFLKNLLMSLVFFIHTYLHAKNPSQMLIFYWNIDD